MPQQTPHPAQIPLPYHILLSTLEPFFALSGAILLLTNSGSYLSTLTRETLTTIQYSSNFIYTQLAGGWLYIAFTEAVLLRFFSNDLRVWRLVCAGILVSDVFHTHSVAQAVGGWAEWVKVLEWTGHDWLVSVTTWPFVLARLGILMGVGIKVEGVKKE